MNQRHRASILREGSRLGPGPMKPLFASDNGGSLAHDGGFQYLVDEQIGGVAAKPPQSLQTAGGVEYRRGKIMRVKGAVAGHRHSKPARQLADVIRIAGQKAPVRRVVLEICFITSS